MVSFTSAGGPLTLELGRMDASMTKLENQHPPSTIALTRSREGAGSFIGIASSGNRRGPPSPESEHGLPLKKARLAEAIIKPAVGDAQVAAALFKRFVNNALDEKLKGNHRHYQELRRKFIAHPSDNDAPSSSELRQTIGALAHTVSRLDKNCSQLVGDIINTTWAGRDGLFFKAYLRLLGNLVSAHSNYIPMATKMLVHHLALIPSRKCALPNHQLVTRQVIYDRAHEALEYLMELVPTAAHSTFFPALVAEFPNKSEKQLAHTTYLTNLLRVVEYAPSLRSKILAMVIERIIKIDIEIQADIEDLEEDEGNNLASQLYNASAIHDDEQGEGEEGSSDSGDDGDREYIPPLQRIKETVDKLDSQLEILFEFFSRYFPAEPQSENHISVDASKIFDNLLESFNKTILPTYQSRYTQFVLFWVTQKYPHFIDTFLGELLGLVQDNKTSQVLRQAAAAYVASFVARAKMMDRVSVRAVVSFLCKWLDGFMITREGNCSGPDLGKFGGFYAVFQAVMYIFCFRWRDLKIHEDGGEKEASATMNQGERWIPELSVMQRAILSKFNPLKVCSCIVVNEFARISNFLNFLYCFSVIASNQRSLLGGAIASAGNSTTTRDGSGGTTRRITEGTVLVPFFPFDPYKLKRSMRWVSGYYVEWEPVPGLDPEESENDEEDEDDEEEEEEDDDDDEEEEEEEGEEEEDGDQNGEGDKDQDEEDGDLTEVDETVRESGDGGGDKLVDE